MILANVQVIEQFRIWIGYRSPLFYIFGYGVDEIILDWIRIAKFPYVYTTAAPVQLALHLKEHD